LAELADELGVSLRHAERLVAEARSDIVGTGESDWAAP